MIVKKISKRVAICLAIAAYTLVGPLEYTINKYFSTYFTYATVDAVCCRVMLGDRCRECGDPGIYSAADWPGTSQGYLTSRQFKVGAALYSTGPVYLWYWECLAIREFRVESSISSDFGVPGLLYLSNYLLNTVLQSWRTKLKWTFIQVIYFCLRQ